MRVFCFTSDRHLWALKAYAWLHRKYWNWPVVVAGFTPPAFGLPENFTFHSIGAFSDYPVERWSDAVIEFLKSVEDDLFVWSMEDFWLLRLADISAVMRLGEYMAIHPEVARIDLTTDRLGGAGVYDVESWYWLDLIANRLPVAYHLSFQVGLWRRTELLKYLVPGETPAESEINGTRRMLEAGAVVLGTRQAPVRNLIAIQMGQITLDGGYQGPEYALKGPDRDELERLGYLDDHD